MHSRRTTKELEAWKSEFGKDYTDRHSLSAAEMDKMLEDYYGGVKKSDIFRQFLPPHRIKSGRVLEVGCNIGTQLKILHMVNPGLELYGLEPQKYAIVKGRQLNPGLHFLQGSAFGLPFKDGFFEVVMTSGVLIHIHPANLHNALEEIHRTSQRFIFCHEYFSEQLQEITYHGREGLLWKMNYMQQYLNQFPDLQCVELRYIRYPDPDTGTTLIDQVCLFEKRGKLSCIELP